MKKPARNTLFSYMYRDASNYKQHGEVVFRGTFTPAQEKALKAALEDGEFFNAKVVKVPEVFFETCGEDDHGWHEFVSLSRTNKKPTDGRKFVEFLGWFVAAARTSVGETNYCDSYFSEEAS